jgi:hypothetical protein
MGAGATTNVDENFAELDPGVSGGVQVMDSDSPEILSRPGCHERREH